MNVASAVNFVWDTKPDFPSFAYSFMHCFVLFNMFLFVYFLVLLYFVFIKNKNKNKFEKSEKYKNNVCLCTLVLVYLGWPLKQSFLNFVSFVA